MRVAIIGAGIAGNTAASQLYREHDVTVFEANDYVGGHSNTVDAVVGEKSYAVDTGFIVYNDRTYPHFSGVLRDLDVRTRPTRMSFSVRAEREDFEYNGTSVNALFAQRANLLRPAFLGMVRDILRFNRDGLEFLRTNSADTGLTLAQFLARGGYGQRLIEHYVIPMGAAIWSTAADRIGEFPATVFLRFCANHGLLSVNDRPTWRVVEGGSRHYVEALTAPFRHRIRLRTPVAKVKRTPACVEVRPWGAEPEQFDAVFFACHSDQALALLTDPTPAEREILGAMSFQRNEAVLHTDASVLPRRQRAWAAWNYHIPAEPGSGVAVTYNMNLLQGLRAPAQILVSLNCADRIDPATVIARFDYAHPLYRRAAVIAQRRHPELNGPRRTYYCGAYWGYGFHEDGVVSALTACRAFSERQHDRQLYLRRTG